MATGAVIDRDRGRTRSVAAARAEAAEAVSMLAQAERLRAEAAAKLIDFDLLDGHVAEGYATPQRHLIHQGNVTSREANRLHRVIRFAASHTLIADALEAGEITSSMQHVATSRCSSLPPSAPESTANTKPIASKPTVWIPNVRTGPHTNVGRPK